MNTTVGRVIGLVAALSLAIIVPGPAAAIPDPGPSSVTPDGSCSLERVANQLVKCDNLTGAGVPAPGWIAQQGGS